MEKMQRRSRKTDPAACPNADLRPPADVSLSRISGAKNNSGGFIEIPVGTIPDSRNSAAKQTNSLSVSSNPPVDQEIVICEVGTIERALVPSPLTSVEHFHAQLPNFPLCITDTNSSESEPVQTVFPFSTFKTYSPTRFVRDLSSFENRIASNNTKHTILATVYNPNGESVSSEKQGEQYVLKQNSLIVVHPILKIRDTREFVAAIPIPRTGDAVADSQLLKRIVIARDTGIDSHVNIRVEESSVISAEADKSTLVLLDRESKFIGKLTDVPASNETSGLEQIFGIRNHGFINQYDHSAHKLASSNLTTTTNNSALELNRQIPTRFIKGVCAICDNCGIKSQDLLACDRCKKPIRAPKLTHDPLLTNVVNNVEKHRAKNTGEQFVGVSSPHFGSVASTPTSTPRRNTRKKAVVQEVTLCSSDEESGNVKVERSSVSIKEQSNNPPVSPATTVTTPIKIASTNGICSPVNMNALSCVPIQAPGSSPFSTGGNFVRIDSTTSPIPEETEVTPEKVMAQIEEILKGKDFKGSLTTLNCRSIRVGSYKHAPPENAPSSLKQVFVSTLGIMFSLPHCVTGVAVKLCLPFNTILSVEGCWKKMPCVFVKTGPKHATWIRKQLGMGNSIDSENYYCPLEGQGNQKSVVLLMERSVKDVEKGVLMKIFGKTLNEITYEVAHKKLIEANPIKPPPQAIPATSTVLPIDVIKTSEPIIINKQIEREPTKVEPPKPEAPIQTSFVSNERDNPDGSQKPREAKRVLKGEWGIELTDYDLESLKDEVFINDQIIDFWLKYMKLYILNAEDRARTYIFSTFFYTKLTNKSRNENVKTPVAERRHARVANWTKKEDIFKYDYILVPIVENAHWILAVICFPSLDGVYDCDTGECISELKTKKAKDDSSRSKGRTTATKLSSNNDQDSFNSGDDNHNGSSSSQTPNSSQTTVPNLDLAKSRKYATSKKTVTGSTPNIKQPCILIFDSLAADLRNKIYATLREYLRIEYKVKKGIEKEFSSLSMPGCMPRVPQQPNYCDCGLYLLQYAESFFSTPIQSFKPPLHHELKQWFQSSVTQKKRQQIYDCIVDLVKKNNPENIVNIPQLLFDDDRTAESHENPLENVVAIQKATEDEDVDVSNDVESSTTSTKSIQRGPLVTKPSPAPALTPHRAPTTSTVMAVVLDHDYIATPKVETPLTTKVKSPPKPPTTVAKSTVPHAVIPQPPPAVGPCEPSKISLTVPILSIKSTTTTSTTVNSVTATQSPARKVPCYANANSPSKKPITEKNFQCTTMPLSDQMSPAIKGSRVSVLKVSAEISSRLKEPSNKPAVIRMNIPNANLSQSVHQTQSVNSCKVIVAQKAITAKSPSTPEQASGDCPRPVREKKDSWKVKEMKSQGDNHDKIKQDPKSPQGSNSANLSPMMMTPIANTMRDSISRKVACSNSVRKQHDQRSQSPAKKRSKLETDKS